MDGLLAPLLNTPECMDSDFGRELLDRMLRRAGCSVRDPARRAFAPPARERCAAPPGFHLPAVFELFLARQMALHRIEGHPGWRVLTCRRRRIVLAMWSGRAQPTVRAWILAAANVRRAAPLPGPMPAILDTAELALRAWLRRETGYRIAEVLGRSGWVRTTRSHIDVTFDASLVDLAIRRAGLDLDPGWSRWLLRVVAVHYDYGQHDA